MKAKIFSKLKQEYSALGLGNEILMSRAEALAATGLVTDDNVDAVVVSQKRDLEELQKLNDKRVNEALEKERKKHQEEIEAKEKAEKEAKEKAEAEAKAKKEAEEKEKSEAARKAKEEAEQKAREEAERKAKEEREQLENKGNIPADLLELIKRERQESETKLADYDKQLRKLISESKKRDEEREKTLAEFQKNYNELLESHKTLRTGYDALKSENDTAKAEKARLERTNFIASKAKELGVPQWRMEEGILISDDADEAAIISTLEKVANNIKTQQLPSQRNQSPLSDEQVTNLDVKDLAKSIVK